MKVVDCLSHLFRLAISAIKQLHPDLVAAVQAKALFSKEEESLMGKVASVSYDQLQICILKRH